MYSIIDYLAPFVHPGNSTQRTDGSADTALMRHVGINFWPLCQRANVAEIAQKLYRPLLHTCKSYALLLCWHCKMYVLRQVQRIDNMACIIIEHHVNMVKSWIAQ